ncbi:hypothetical protein BJ508DRAFT_315247 [Ascobolus immersus RN42]|uniref:BTB domain-containing protein n=1 Tax=Ascobolus immersus RN42 TaxID=1160509 RepID=A0A3N4HG83_ASCIM|nr:hypothetical protein BJ508DRAFT_315247 [Ascobolus immersus RN42]
MPVSYYICHGCRWMNDEGYCHNCGVALKPELLYTKEEYEAKGTATGVFNRFPEVARGDTIKVILSQTEKREDNVPAPITYNLHTAYLAKVSQYFAALLKFPGKKNETGEVRLGEACDHPVPFGYFIQFLYAEDYDVRKEHEPLDVVVHAMVYILADRLIVEDLKKLAFAKLKVILQSNSGSSSSWKAISEMQILALLQAVYEGTPPPNQQQNDHSRNPFNFDQALQLLSLKNKKTGTNSKKTQNREQSLRSLVSQFAASKLTALKAFERFHELLQEYPDLAVDIASAAGNGVVLR